MNFNKRSNKNSCYFTSFLLLLIIPSGEGDNEKRNECTLSETKGLDQMLPSLVPAVRY
jgi:hypothetical protein